MPVLAVGYPRVTNPFAAPPTTLYGLQKQTLQPLSKYKGHK